MSSLRVVEHFDVVEDIGPCLLVGVVDPTLDPLPLQQLEEALDDGVVVTVAPPAHAADDPVHREKLLPLLAGKLTALVGVQQQSWRWLSVWS
jgi:hypothetical protein